MEINTKQINIEKDNNKKTQKNERKKTYDNISWDILAVNFSPTANTQ